MRLSGFQIKVAPKDMAWALGGVLLLGVGVVLLAQALAHDAETSRVLVEAKPTASVAAIGALVASEEVVVRILGGAAVAATGLWVLWTAFLGPSGEVGSEGRS